jgi:hypothetical protein
MKPTCSMPSPPPDGDDGPRLHSRGLNWDPVMSTGMRTMVDKMRIRMRSKKDRKPMMNQSSIWRTEGLVLESVKIGLYISEL